MAYGYFENFMDKEDLEKIKEISTLNELCERFPLFSEKRSVWGFDFSASYAKFYEEIALARGFLAGAGVNKGDHVALVMKNQYEFLLYFLAVTTLGAVALPISMQTPPNVILPLCKKHDVKFALCNELIMPAFSQASESGIKAYSVKEVIFDKTAPSADVESSAPAAIMFTGGTTGGAKGVVLSHSNLMRGTINGVYGCPHCFDDSYLALLPFTHVFGLVRGGLTALYTGSEIYMCEEMKNIFRDLALAKPTVLILVPALAGMVWGVAATKGFEAIGGRLSYIISGGAVVPPQLITMFKQFKVNLYPGYGLTESANLVSGNVAPDRKPTSVGQLYGFQEHKVVDGELLLKGENIMLGYYKNDAANSEAFTEDGFFKTGDLVRFDEDGDLYITGRIKNLIILSNGENVSPEEIEALINSIPLVQDSLVYEGKSAVGFPVIEAEILPNFKAAEKAGVTDAEEAIRSAVSKLNDGLPEFMRIKKIVMRETDFARSPSMKILRKN